MFQKTELARLQAQKELLVLQSNANRLLLALDWQQLRSPENWRDEVTRRLRQHPLASAGLMAAIGALAALFLRRPGAAASGIGWIGKLAPMIFAVWRFMRRGKPEI